MVSSSLTWYHNIAEFLKTQQMPTNLNMNDRRKVHINNRHFSIADDRLYHRGIDDILQRCVDSTEILAILASCHSSAYSEHISGTLTDQKILRVGYYSPSMFRDAHDNTKHCNACQRYAGNDLRMALPLHVSFPLVPFEK